jgi:hypothetical protein
MKPLVSLAKTIRKRREGILAAVRLGVNNARHEGLNRRVRLIVYWAYGFHSANAALALIMVTLGPIEHILPHERHRASDPWIDPHSCREGHNCGGCFKSPNRTLSELIWLRTPRKLVSLMRSPALLRQYTWGEWLEGDLHIPPSAP